MTRRSVCLWIATCSYIGYLPFAPGTWATAACALVLWLASPLVALPAIRLPFLLFSALIIGVAGFLALKCLRLETEDPSYVVVDETLGMCLTMVGHALTPFDLVKGFILFRAFDILKPYPLRHIERLPGPAGVLADDVGAAVFANAGLFLWSWLQ